MNLIVQKHLLGTEDISIRSAILRLSAAKTQTHAEKKRIQTCNQSPIWVCLKIVYP